MSSDPIRIFHLVDLDAGFQTCRGAESLSAELGAGFEVRTLTIGAGGDFNSLVAAMTRLRRHVAGTPHVIHAWGGRALAAAVTRPEPIIYTLADSPSTQSLRWAQAAMSHRDIQLICPSATLRRASIERGMAVERTHLIRPGIQFARIRRRRDRDLRGALGFGDNDRVLLFTGESTRLSGHRESLWASAILHVLDPKYRSLTWGRGSQTHALKHFAAGQGQAKLLAVAEERLGRRVEFEDLLPAADIVLASPVGSVGTLPISIAMAAALPIVATVSYTIGELLEDRHTALLAAPGSPKALARRVLDLEADTNLQWSISDMARTEAYEYFAMTRFVNQYRGVYRQIADGIKVDVPQMAPGVGMRFHGRG